MGSLLHLDVRDRLLCVVFYSNPALYLLAPGSTLSGAEGVAIGIGSLIAGWFIYDFSATRPGQETGPARHPVRADHRRCYGFSKVFSGRGAYLHTGAIIGTIMVGNVFRIIMPAQRSWWRPSPKNRRPTRRCRPKACCVRVTTTTSPCRCCSS
jgi:uncharacterized membrane protein